ncbi:MAG: YopX family protein [Bacteroides sp.]|nr:YopX family protein [Bacteroides sp.]
MQRDIKFRGADIDSGEWVYGSLVVWPDLDMSILFPAQGGDRKQSATEMEDRYIVPGAEGQFTGLYDRNGKEIYEGDIVDFGFGPREKVIFKDGRFAVVSKEKPDVHTALSVFACVRNNRVTVVGSEYQEPELF